jgi:hypothetical protein
LRWWEPPLYIIQKSGDSRVRAILTLINEEGDDQDEELEDEDIRKDRALGRMELDEILVSSRC